MFKIQNDTPRYNNQYYDVKDNPKLVGDEAVRTCNITSASMITNEDPNDVLEKFFCKYGINYKFQWEELLIAYLRDEGHLCESITASAYPNAREITDDELKKIILELKKGNIIFFHKEGHYQLLIGCIIQEGKTLDDIGSIDFIFNDPAGDRKLPRYARLRESGHAVIYPYAMVKAEKIYGRCWSVVL